MKQSSRRVISLKSLLAFILLAATLAQSLGSAFSFFYDNSISLVEIDVKNEKSEEKVEIKNLIFQRKIISAFSQNQFAAKPSWNNSSILWFNIEADVLLRPPEQHI